MFVFEFEVRERTKRQWLLRLSAVSRLLNNNWLEPSTEVPGYFHPSAARTM